MNPKLEIPIEEFNELSPSAQIRALCAYHECSPDMQDVHYSQYVKRKWNPHPPLQFIAWWPHFGALQTEARTGRAWLGVTTESAFNCEVVREVYRESKEHGTLLVEPPMPEIDPNLTMAERFAKLKSLTSRIGQPMPKPQPMDYDAGNEPIEF